MTVSELITQLSEYPGEFQAVILTNEQIEVILGVSYNDDTYEVVITANDEWFRENTQIHLSEPPPG